jgi:hypothetical protein
MVEVGEEPIETGQRTPDAIIEHQRQGRQEDDPHYGGVEQGWLANGNVPARAGRGARSSVSFESACGGRQTRRTLL